MRIGNKLRVCLRGLSAVPVSLLLHGLIHNHVDMHFHRLLLSYACISLFPKQNHQQHAQIAFILNLEDAFWSSEATGNLERNSFSDAWDGWWRVWKCHVVNAVTARACAGHARLNDVCVSLEREREDDPGESRGPAGSCVSPRLSVAPWASGLAQLGSAAAGTENDRTGCCLLLQHRVSKKRVCLQ